MRLDGDLVPQPAGEIGNNNLSGMKPVNGEDQCHYFGEFVINAMKNIDATSWKSENGCWNDVQKYVRARECCQIRKLNFL